MLVISTVPALTPDCALPIAALPLTPLWYRLIQPWHRCRVFTPGEPLAHAMIPVVSILEEAQPYRPGSMGMVLALDVKPDR